MPCLSSRLLLAMTATALSVASCGQKGPLVLPEDKAQVADVSKAPIAIRLTQVQTVCGRLLRA